MKRLFPWWAKIIIKLLLSRIPLSYHAWALVGVFRHGHMEEPGYALHVFQEHFEKSGFFSKDTGFVSMELGVGDSVASAIIARTFGAVKCYLVDVARFATEDIEKYKQVVINPAKNYSRNNIFMI